MPYGIIKVDQVTFTNAGVDQTISVSGIVASISGNITATGTISGNVIRGGTTVSGATVTGTAGQFGTITGNTAGFTTVTGTTVTGTTATFTSGVFTNISGGTHTITSGVFASGTAANPSIAFQGDVNTGIYSPGADQVAISTNGTGRLFVNASGHLLVNETSNPLGYYLVVNTGTGTNNNAAILSNNANADLRFNLTGGVSLVDANTGTLALGTSGSERLRITSAGLVGVGTSSPQAQLQVLDRIKISDSTQAQGSLQLGDGASTSFNVGVARWNGSTNAAGAGGLGYFSQGTANSGGHYFYTGDAAAGSQTPRMVILPGGNVGIGTSSPSSLLHVQGSASNIFRVTTTDTGASNILSINNNDNFNYGIIGVTSGNGTAGGDVFGAGYTSVLTSDFTPVINWTSQGRVGIGTTAPIAKLDIYKGAGGSYADALILSNDAGFGANQGIAWGSSANISGRIRGLDDGAYGTHLIFENRTGGPSTTTTERARIDSSGRLLVGTSSAVNTAGSGLLQVVGGDAARPVIHRNLNDQYPPMLYFSKARGTGNQSVSSGDEVGAISFLGYDGTQGIEAANIRCLVDATPGTNDMPGRLVFSTTADGASSPTEQARIPNGGGLCVGSTVSPNSLTQASGIRLGSSTIASYDFTNITTSPVTIANGVGIGGLAFVQAYNTSTGAQYVGLIMWRSGVVAVVSESNALGFALTYSVSGSTLRLQTASGTISGSVITLAS